MSCRGCGKCCRYPFSIEVENSEGIPEFFLTKDKKYMMFTNEGICSALNQKNNECSIYDRRPNACKSVSLGDECCSKSIMYSCGSLSVNIKAEDAKELGIKDNNYFLSKDEFNHVKYKKINKLLSFLRNRT